MAIKKIVAAWIVAGLLAPTSLSAWAAPSQEEVFKETQEVAKRMRKQNEEWIEDSKLYREERKRVFERQEAARKREAEFKRQQETKEAAELAAAKNARDQQKVLEKARREAQARLEQAERERQAEIAKLREVEEKLNKRKAGYDKEIEELRMQGKLGGEIQFGVDL